MKNRHNKRRVFNDVNWPSKDKGKSFIKKPKKIQKTETSDEEKT